MANCYYERILIDATKLLLITANKDNDYVKSTEMPIKDAFNIVADVYVNYIQVANKLTKCFMNMIPTLVRDKIFKLWVIVVNRILEIKREMVNLENTDVPFMDNIIIENNLTRWDVDLDIPEKFRDERYLELSKLEKKIVRMQAEAERKIMQEKFEKGELDDNDSVIIAANISDLSDIDGFDQKQSVRPSKISSIAKSLQALESTKILPEEFDITEKVLLIQKHERARVVRLKIQKEYEHDKLIEDVVNAEYVPIPSDLQLSVALIIQRIWRNYRQRRKEKYIRVQRRLILDQYLASNKSQFLIPKLKQANDTRRIRQMEDMLALQDIAYLYKLRIEGKLEIIQADLEMELLHYIKDWYNITREIDSPGLPEWPEDKPIKPPKDYIGFAKKLPANFVKDEELAQLEVMNDLFGHTFKQLFGSKLIIAGHMVPPRMWVNINTAMKDWKKLIKTGAYKQKLKARKRKEKYELRQKRLEEKRKKKLGYAPKKSQYVDHIVAMAKDAVLDFCPPAIISDNKGIEGGYNETECKTNEELMDELWMLADEEIRNKMDVLKSALAKDKRTKYKPQIRKGKIIKKPKEGEDDTKQVFETLVTKDILQIYKRTLFSELDGEYSFKSYELRKDFLEDPVPSMGDMFQTIKEYCVLPLACSGLRTKMNLKPSILLVGQNCYTQPIVNAICTEAGATLFYLDPLNLANNFDEETFVNIITKSPQTYQPVVIHIDNVEKPFYKKEPPNEVEQSPKFLTPIIPKLIKSINENDRILVIGTTEKPWEAVGYKLVRTFNQVITLPDIDPFTLAKCWRDSLMKYTGVDREFDYTALVLAFKDAKTDDIKATVEELMDINRTLSLYHKPLKQEELENLLPINVSTQRSYWSWAKENVPMFMKRKKMLKKELKDRDNPEDLTKKKKPF